MSSWMSRSAIAVVLLAPSIAAANPCETVSAAHKKDTVVVFSPPSSFAICRDGSEESDVVTGRRVYLELAPTPGASMFRFRVHGQEAEPKLTGLTRRSKEVRDLAGALEELAHSAAHIANTSLGGTSTDAGVARARYLGVVTPDFSESLAHVRQKVDDLAESARVAQRWCDELHHSDFTDPNELRGACDGLEHADDLAKSVARFDAAASAFDAARDLAREATIAAAAHEDEHTSTNAMQSLDLARGAAQTIVARAAELGVVARSIARRLAALRAAIGTLGALRPNNATYLTTYGEAGNANLRIDAIPVGVDEDARDVEANQVSFRYQVVGRHYFDVEIGAGVTGGQPLIPTVTTSGNAAVIDGKAVDEFVALALVELEPFRFGWPDKPLAGVVRFPVIGIPLSRDPTQNFFVGAGLGWTGVGSITAGPYLLRELTLLPGHSIGDALPAGTSLDAITNPKVNVGFYVSASIDVVGLFRLFFPEHLPTMDAATGRVE